MIVIKRKKILILTILLAIAALAIYLAYTEYQNSQTRFYLSESHKHKNAANDYLTQADSYEKDNDYTNAITALDKSTDEVNKALENDQKALDHAIGIYREYVDTDILLLEKIKNLIEYKVYVNRYRTDTLNKGQERVAPEKLTPFIDKLETEIAEYKSQLEQIKSSHPREFSFLK